MRFLTLNIGASKALLAEYNVSGKGKLTITAKDACANFKGSVVKTFRVK